MTTHPVPTAPSRYTPTPEGVMAESVRQFVESYKATHDGEAPAYKQVARHLGIAKTTVAYHVANLRRAGRIGDMLPPPSNIGPLARHIRNQVAKAVQAERRRQDVLFPGQSLPFLPPELASPKPHQEMATALAWMLRVPTAKEAREACQLAGRRGNDSWARVVLEEVCEWFEAIANGDITEIRKEGVQVAATIMSAIEDQERKVQRAQHQAAQAV